MDSAESLSLVDRTADPAFAVDRKHRVVAWNKGAEALLGYEAGSMLGKRCYRILGGTDVFGNRFCDRFCPVINMAHREEKVNPFELNLRTRNAEMIPTKTSIIVLGQEASNSAIMHILKPVNRERGQHIHRDEKLSNWPSSSPIRLTRREIYVLRQLAEGAGTDQIAEHLRISLVTVRNHVQAILRKLRVHSRIEAVSLARSIGII